MTEINKIDLVLNYLNNDKDRSEKILVIQSNLSIQIPIKDLHLILQKINADGNCSIGYGKTGGIKNEIRHYFITYQGKIFLSNGGYSKQAKSIWWNDSWIKTKTIANLLNTLLLLSVAIIGIWITYDSKEKDTKIELQESQIQTLKTTIDSLHYQKMTNSDTININK